MKFHESIPSAKETKNQGTTEGWNVTITTNVSHAASSGG